MASSSSAVVEQSIHDPTFKGSYSTDTYSAEFSLLILFISQIMQIEKVAQW
jgi:hypothetical protein